MTSELSQENTGSEVSREDAEGEDSGERRKVTTADDASSQSWDKKDADQVQENIDQAAKAASDFDFATLDELKRAFKK
jgi:hypothetical protein